MYVGQNDLKADLLLILTIINAEIISAVSLVTIVQLHSFVQKNDCQRY